MEKTNTDRKNIKLRKIYIDLLTSEKITQIENFCSNQIRTTKYTM